MMRFQDLLMGRTTAGQQRLEGLFATLEEERVLWYPSAGDDYRDLLYLHPAKSPDLGLQQTPNIFCHTDYDFRYFRNRTDPLFQDGYTCIRIKEFFELELRPDLAVDYRVSPYYATFTDHAARRPQILLLDLDIVSNQLGHFEKSIFYFFFENYNFLGEILLKQGVEISHFVKIREGCGFGGCRKSITVFYSMLANLNVRYLLVDNEIHYCRRTHDQYALRYGVDHKKFSLHQLGALSSWSDFPVKTFEVIAEQGLLTAADLFAVLQEISGREHIDIF
jgi:hypothetical protein